MQALKFSCSPARTEGALVVDIVIGFERGLMAGLFKAIDHDFDGANQVLDFLYHPEARTAEIAESLKAFRTLVWLIPEE